MQQHLNTCIVLIQALPAYTWFKQKILLVVPKFPPSDDSTSFSKRFFHIWGTRIQSYKTIWKKIFRPHVKHEPQVKQAHSGIVLDKQAGKHMRKCGQWFGSVQSREGNLIFSRATLEYYDQHMDACGSVGENFVYRQRLPTPPAECFHFRINFWRSLHSQSVTSYLNSSRSQVSRLHQCARKSV